MNGGQLRQPLLRDHNNPLDDLQDTYDGVQRRSLSQSAGNATSLSPSHNSHVAVPISHMAADAPEEESNVYRSPSKPAALAYDATHTRQRWLVRAITIIACLAWTSVSSLAILVNKKIMVDLKFRYPCTIAWMGLTTTTVASFIAVRLAVPAHKRRAIGLRYYATRVAPTGFFMALTFQTGNMGYLYLSVAFVQMLKVSVLGGTVMGYRESAHS